MADFPALNPQSRAYTPGAFAAYRAITLQGDEISIRRNNAALDHRLSLTFVSGSVSDHNTIFNHYVTHNRFTPFDMPASVLSGSDLSFPSGYQFIYAAPPQATMSPGQVTVSVELQLVPPYKI